VYVDDLDIPLGKLTEGAQRVMDRAVEESRRREHALLTSAHVLYAFAQADWDLFAQAMRGVKVNPHEVLHAIDEHLRRVPSFTGREVRVSPTTKLLCKLALHQASRAGHPGVEAADLLLALFEETHGVPVSILRQHGAEPDVLVSRLQVHFRDLELRNERLKKRFELPSSLKQFATNLNWLAWQDKLPPVQFGHAGRRTGRRQDGGG
jgi:ATP-dependent Clp protease ATP-binding subunit ClpA